MFSYMGTVAKLWPGKVGIKIATALKSRDTIVIWGKAHCKAWKIHELALERQCAPKIQFSRPPIAGFKLQLLHFGPCNFLPAGYTESLLPYLYIRVVILTLQDFAMSIKLGQCKTLRKACEG